MVFLSCISPNAHDTLPRSTGRRYNSQPSAPAAIGLSQRSPAKLQSKRNSHDAPARRKVAKISISQPRDFKHLTSGAGMSGGADLDKTNLDQILSALSAPFDCSLQHPTGDLPRLAEIEPCQPLSLTSAKSPFVQEQDENVIVVEKAQKRQSRKPPPAITPSVIRSVPVNSPDRAQLPTQPLKLSGSGSAKGIPSSWTTTPATEKELPSPVIGSEEGQGTTIKFNAAMSEVQHALKMDLDDPALKSQS